MEDSLIDNESTRTQVQHDLTEARFRWINECLKRKY